MANTHSTKITACGSCRPNLLPHSACSSVCADTSAPRCTIDVARLKTSRFLAPELPFRDDAGAISTSLLQHAQRLVEAEKVQADARACTYTWRARWFGQTGHLWRREVQSYPTSFASPEKVNAPATDAHSLASSTRIAPRTHPALAPSRSSLLASTDE
eukprot:6177105-Pleurochrysis_carterae.AAC.1